jgi:hypothetical protein
LSDDLLTHPIWKLESDDAEEVLVGEFCLRYMLSVITDRTLYLGQCSCSMAQQFAMPIIGFEAEMPCVFCGQPVALKPVPRVQSGRWVVDDPTGKSASIKRT